MTLLEKILHRQYAKTPIVALASCSLVFLPQTPSPAAAPAAATLQPAAGHGPLRRRRKRRSRSSPGTASSLAGRLSITTVTTGLMPIKSDNGEVEAHMFFMAYTVRPPQGAPVRPLTFSFNGGPGSASVWLHLGRLDLAALS